MATGVSLYFCPGPPPKCSTFSSACSNNRSRLAGLLLKWMAALEGIPSRLFFTQWIFQGTRFSTRPGIGPPVSRMVA